MRDLRHTMNEYLTMQYMAGFRCIGSDCEEHCCGGWGVSTNQGHFEKLQHTMSQTPALRDEFQSAFRVVDQPMRTSKFYALMRRTEAGNCCMLDAAGLCTLQKRFGAGALSNICGLYPRIFSQTGNRMEMAGTLSCPEIARRALLADDALDLIDFDPAAVLNGQNPDLKNFCANDAYASYLDDIRRASYELLSLSHYPLSDRLFFLSYFAARTVPFFHQGVQSVDETQLREATSDLTSPVRLDELHQWFEQCAVPNKFIGNFILELLKVRVSEGCCATFRDLVSAVFATYGGIAPTSTETGTPFSEDELVTEYTRRRDTLVSRFGHRVDRYFENYAKNYWLKEWYTDSANLLVHTQDLLARIAVLRFMLFSLAKIPADLDNQEATDLLDKEAVRVFYKFSRGIEHKAEFLRKLTQTLEAPEMEMLARTVHFIKF